MKRDFNVLLFTIATYALVAMFLIGYNIREAKAEVYDPLTPALILQGADYLQTLQISKSCHSDGRYFETNPIMGRCPSQSDVTKYFAASTLVGLALHEVLPKKYKPYASYIWVSIEATAVAHNASIGIKVGF